MDKVNGFRRFFNKTWKDSIAADSRVGSFVRGEYLMGHKGMTSLDKNYFQTNLLELAAAYMGVAPDLIIDDARKLKRSTTAMSATIQRLEEEKDSTVADLKKEVADLQQKNLMVTDMLERAKAEKAASGADSKLVADLARRLQNQDDIIREMRAEHAGDVEKLEEMVKNLVKVVRRGNDATKNAVKAARFALDSKEDAAEPAAGKDSISSG